jgi:PIN domain nuclease of toxin-antitoxin system
MARLIYLDTHVVAWLHGLGPSSLSERAAELIEAAEELRCSPMVRLELQYLLEVGRTTAPAVEVLDALNASLGLVLCDVPFPAVVRAAEAFTWTRDPFDRLIAAQASLFDAPLVTKDELLHRHYPHATW